MRMGGVAAHLQLDELALILDTHLRLVGSLRAFIFRESYALGQQSETRESANCLSTCRKHKLVRLARPDIRFPAQLKRPCTVRPTVWIVPRSLGLDSSVFEAMAMLAPSAAARSAMARPMPRLAPVMNRVLPLTNRIM